MLTAIFLPVCVLLTVFVVVGSAPYNVVIRGSFLSTRRTIQASSPQS